MATVVKIADIQTPVQRDLDAKRDLIKRTICRGASDDELELFVHACKRTGLDPFMKQIYAVKRRTGDGEVMTIQTGIDGLRLIADRTGNYSPGREPSFQYNEEGKVKSATSYLRKRTRDGVWHEVSATAFFEEYRPSHKSQFWDYKPHIMLAKCAEALALRKAFPAEMSGLYTSEEMEQANEAHTSLPNIEEVPLIEESQEELVKNLLEKIEIPHGEAYLQNYLKFVQSKLSKDRSLTEVMKGWLKDPEPFLKHYKSWISKNKVDNMLGQNSNEYATI